MSIIINPDLLKQVQNRLSVTAKSLLQQSAIPILTLGIDTENKLVLIADENLTKENMISFLQQIVAGLQSHTGAIVIPHETFANKKP